MRDGIDGADVGSGGRFEKIVGVLPGTLHPDTERIGRAGGDGGRDHQLRTDGRFDPWQSTYVLGRLPVSAARRRQVTRSLA